MLLLSFASCSPNVPQNNSATACHCSLVKVQNKNDVCGLTSRTLKVTDTHVAFRILIGESLCKRQHLRCSVLIFWCGEMDQNPRFCWKQLRFAERITGQLQLYDIPDIPSFFGKFVSSLQSNSICA